MKTSLKYLRAVVCLLLLGLTVKGFAVSTTYTFTSKSWKSQVGSIVCDGKTDGWIGEADGYGYGAGSVYPVDNLLHNAGVQVVAASAGKKVTSVLEFANVRKVIVNYCIASSAKSDITITIGDTVMSRHVEKSMKINQDASINEDVEFVLLRERTGKVALSIENMTKSTYINSITIKADNGSGEVFSTKVYHLVTDVAQLQDEDLIMIGVADGKINKALGYFDANVSDNNIHAVNAKYDATREYININEEVVYVLNKVDGKGFTIMDPYEEAYLVASGGQTKNKLTIWTSPSSSGFGDYGYWDIQVESDGKATIMSRGTSKGKYMQYNMSGDLFGCYASETQTAVSIYRQEEAKDPEQAMIVAPLVNFGTQVLRGEELAGSKTIEVKANKLSQNITASLQNGSMFSLSATTLDRDGDKLTVSFKASAAGKYSDVLVLTSGELTEEVPVTVHIARELSIAEAVQSGDFEYIYLNALVVTKKYDKYVYVRDETGSMVLFDKGPSDAPYAKGLEKGNVLRNVSGKYQNYWGVPELLLMEKPNVDVKPVECLPEEMTECADSADVCRYISYKCVQVTKEGEMQIIFDGQTLPLTNKFGNLGQESESFTSLNAGKRYNIEGIVSYDYDAVVLYPTFISVCEETGIEESTNTASLQEGSPYQLRLLPDGQIVIVGEGKTYDLRGISIDNVLD